MSVRALKTLLAIHDEGSFQAAAKRLNMTLSAASMQMKQLEEVYATALFDRSTRPPSLTSLGVKLAEASRSVISGYEDLSLLLRSEAPLSGRINLGIATASIRLLPQLTKIMKERFPDLDINIESAISIKLIERVSQGALDAALLTPQILSDDLLATTILTEPMVLVAAKSKRSQLAINLIHTHPFILFDPRTGIGKAVDAFLTRQGNFCRKVTVLDSLEAIVELVALDMGVTIIPEPEAARYGRGRVVWTNELGSELQRNLALITRRSAGSLHLHKTLADAFHAALSADSLLQKAATSPLSEGQNLLS
ncbi:LysR family transcriptional regulator [[Pseudomonas] carboxydohydrogena]